VTLQTAYCGLSDAVAQLWSAVAELALIALEDRPASDGLAVADDIAEQVSELQGAVAELRDLLGRSPVDLLPRLPAVQAQLDAATVRYWQRLRAHDPIARLRSATRRRGGEWVAWQRSVERSTRNCIEPLSNTAGALNSCWQEVCQRLTSGEPAALVAGSPSVPYRRMS
jgi:hypothetical protein